MSYYQEELNEKYKNRNLMEELSWGYGANHQGYTSKEKSEFINWLCGMAYDEIKRLSGIIVNKHEWKCSDCKWYEHQKQFCKKIQKTISGASFCEEWSDKRVDYE